MAGQALTRLVKRPASARPLEEARTVRLDGRDVAIVLRRSERRTFALQIDERGVRVSAPHRARDADVERFVAGHSRWLLDKLAALHRQGAAQRFDAVDGALVPFLGVHCRLRIADRGRGARWTVAADGVEELCITRSQEPYAAIVRALRNRALPWFGGRVAEYCFRLGRDVPAVRLSSARTRWGSCSATSGIRLHWRLIHLRPALIDYVVAHEVAHLAEMNHSPRFWAVVGALYPDWRVARAELRAAGRALPSLAADAGAPLFNED